MFHVKPSRKPADGVSRETIIAIHQFSLPLARRREPEGEKDPHVSRETMKPEA
jgi:hypothetical protein